jgi:SAM-dependent methyltransferase
MVPHTAHLSTGVPIASTRSPVDAQTGSIVAPVARDFCTLFDSNYLARGLVTIRSLREVEPDARIHVLCMDADTERLLGELDDSVNRISLDDFEAANPELASTKAGRSRAEYCWTATPALSRHVLAENVEAAGVTYIDADLMFFGSVEPLFAELADDAVLIVPHGYAPQWAAQELTHGIYNVEWLTFRRDDRALAVLDWWHDRCIEWCYARVEDGKFGDQKYLDVWPDRFAGVHVLTHPGGGLAPWNAPRHRLTNKGGSISVDGERLVFFHAHSLALHRDDARLRALARLDLPLGPRVDEGVGWTTNYPVGATDRAWIWVPYLRRLLAADADVRAAAPSLPSPYVPVDLRKILHPVAGTVRRRARELGALAASSLRRNGRPSTDAWRSGAAAEMLALVRSQLESPDAVAPFRGFRYAVDAVLAEAEADRPLRILDVGCGVGHYSELVERWYPKDVEYTGADASEEMVDAASSAWPGRRFVVDDVLAPRLDYGAFDVLLAGALVDVLAEWRPALDAILGSGAPYVILHRQRLSPRRTSVRRARGYANSRTYRTVLAEADLSDALRRNGREIVTRLPIETGVETLVLRKSGT